MGLNECISFPQKIELIYIQKSFIRLIIHTSSRYIQLNKKLTITLCESYLNQHMFLHSEVSVKMFVENISSPADFIILT